ncbi:MAG: DUF1207 domain-containing protein [Ignavibacteria bacterium]|nr:DUF1207 domain-containing protein [Ignavibacteria bacterium]
MKRIVILAFFISSLFINSIYSQNTSTLYFFSTERVFEPTRASVFEPRVGFLKNVNDKNLRLDIGVGIDLIGLNKDDAQYSFGVDAFTFSNLKSESNFKFPVDAIDYFFGVNFNYKRPLSNDLFVSSRLRISHISSHLQDGHVYERADTIFTPFTYSREFIDIAVVLDKLFDRTLIKNLFAVNFLFSSIPDDFALFSFQYGIEVQYYAHEFLSLYFSNDIKLATVSDKTNLNENLEMGIRIGEYNSRGVNLFFSYYDGQDYKGQYYNRYLNYKAIGMCVDF